MKKLIILPFLFWMNHGFSCEIQGPDKVYLTKNTKEATIQKAFSFKECSQDIIDTFTKVILEVKGTVHHSQFPTLLSNHNVDVKNNTIRIFDLSMFVNEKLNLSADQLINDVSFLNGEDAVFAYQDQELSTVTRSAIKAGENTIALELTSPFSNAKQEWIKVNVVYKIMAMTAKEHMRAHQGALTPNHFKWDYIQTTTPEKYHTNKDAIIFYTLTRNIRAGEPLESSMLTPVSIVQAGVPTKIEYINSKVSLSGLAIPMRAGKIGETIQLRNTKTNKVISGKVVDFNRVVIEL
jgi:flagella basal body P-ring formation protein FlgA